MMVELEAARRMTPGKAAEKGRLYSDGPIGERSGGGQKMAVAATLTVDLARKVVCTVLINPRSKFVASARRFFLPGTGASRDARAGSELGRRARSVGAEPWSSGGPRGRNRRFTPRNRLERSGQLLYLA
jgi:hypothetical protein